MVNFDKKIYGNLKLIDEFTVRKNASAYSINRRKDVARLVTWSESKDNHIAVQAWDFKELKDSGGLYYYSYDMMRMGRLSGEQRFVVKLISDWIYEYKLDPFNIDSLNDSQRDQVNKIWDNHRDLMLFLMIVTKDGRYRDLHEGNVMIHPETEEFRLIDLEGFMNGAVNLNWLDEEKLLM